MATYATDVYSGTGSQVDFAVTFDFIQRDHVKVYRVDNSDQARTELTQTDANPTGDEYQWQSNILIQLGTAPTTEQKLLIQRDTPENQQIIQWSDGSYIIADDLNTSDLQLLYGLQELEDKFELLQTTAIKYLGAIDLTVDAAPADPEGGAFFINTGDGSVLPSWTGIAGDLVVGSEQVIYNGALFEWQIFEVPSSKIGVVDVIGTAPIVVDDTDNQRPVVSITGATQSADGSLSAVDKTKLDNYPAIPPNGTTISPTPPPNPVASDQWWDSNDGRGYVYYEDDDSSQWVEMNPSWNGSIPDGSVTTDKIADGAVTPAKLDRAYVEVGDAVGQIVAGNNVTITPSTGKGVVTINSTGGGSGGTTVNYNGASAWGDIASNATINASLNISSVVKNGAGYYTVTFTTPMPTNRYAITVGGNAPEIETGARTINGFDINTNDSDGNPDSKSFSFAVQSSSAIAPPSGVGADAWGSVANDASITASYNIASVATSQAGLYNITFVTPMPSDSYCVTTASTGTGAITYVTEQSKTINGFTIETRTPVNNALANQRFDFAVQASSTVTPTYTWKRDGTTLKTANAGDMVVVGTYDESSDTTKGTRIGLFTANSAVQTQVPLTTSGSAGVYNVYQGTTKTINFTAGGSASFASSVGASRLFTTGTSAKIDINYNGNGSSGINAFEVNDSTGNKMAVATDGSATFGPASGGGKIAMEGMGGTEGTLLISNPTGSNSFNCFRVISQGTNKIAFTQGGTISAANTTIQPISSERRLKENIVSLDPIKAWDTIKSLPFYAYNYKTDAIKDVTYGPIVDEVPADLVRPTGMNDEEGKIRTYDNGLLQARLYVALQTALTRIEALEAKVTQLEGGTNS